MNTKPKPQMPAALWAVLSEGIDPQKRMRIRFRIPALLVLLFSTFAMTSVFGQVVETWTNAAGGLITVATSWDPNTLPNGNDGSTIQQTAAWDNRVTTDLVLTYGGASLPNTGFGTIGINLMLTGAQTNNIQLVSSAATSAAVGVAFLTNDSPNAALILGDSTANQLVIAARPAASEHFYVNNSAAANVINKSVQLLAGGGNAYTIHFAGSGNWTVNNNLRNNNSGAGPVTVIWEGPGTMTWSSGSTFLASDILGPVGINSGTVVVKSTGLLPTFPIFVNGAGPGNNTITNDGTLELDDAGLSDTITRAIIGTGAVQNNSGTNTLGGQNTYGGNTLITGGELIVGSAENLGVSGPLGLGGVISFGGGTLGYSSFNTFDYSSRFSTAAGQQVSVDTAGLGATWTSGLSSSGGSLTKLGAGTLTLDGTSSYTGPTMVSVGKLVFVGSKTGAGSVTVADGQIVGFTETGTPATPTSLAVGVGAGATLEFNNVTNTSTAPIASGTATSGGTITININSGLFSTIGETFPLFTWSSGTAPAVTLGVLAGAGGHLTTNGNAIDLVIDQPPYIWTGVNGSPWDHATVNWVQSGVPLAFSDGAIVLFDDSATGTTNVAVSGIVLPKSTTVGNNSLNYTITTSAGNDIEGTNTLSKNGTGTLTLSGGNLYTGVTTVGGGTVSVSTLANGGTVSDIGASGNGGTNLVFNGGVLQYTGAGANIDRLFTIGTGGGGFDASGSGTLILNNTGAAVLGGSGPRTFILQGTNTSANTLASQITDSSGGATAVTKNGSGTWVLTATNTYSGLMTIAAGQVQIGVGGVSGSIGNGNIINNGTIDFQRSGTLTVSGAISGNGAVTNDGTGTLILAGNNSYTGGTINNPAVAILQVGNGGATGTLDSGSPVTNNGTLIFNSTGGSIISGVISGSGQLIKRGSGLLKLIGNNTFTGGITIDSGAQLQISQGNTGGIQGNYNITNNGALIFVRQDNAIFFVTNNIIGTGSVTEDVNNPNSGDTTLFGTNTYSGNTFIKGGAIILGDGLTPGSGSIVGNVTFQNSVVNDTLRSLTFNHPSGDDFTFPGNIVGAVVQGAGTALANAGRIVQNGFNTVTLTGNNTYPAGTVINSGGVQVGNGGGSGTLGTGAVTDNGLLTINRTGNLLLPAGISGTGSVIKLASGAVTVTGAATYSGSTTVSNGSLALLGGGSVGGIVQVEGGTLIIGTNGVFAPGTFTAGAGVQIDSGEIQIAIDRSLAATTTNIMVTGPVIANGGTLKILNTGATVQIGDKFAIFNEAITGSLTIVTPGFTVANNLALDGTVTVNGVSGTRPTITESVVGSTLNVNWPIDWKGLYLQGQTNTLKVGITTNWTTIPGSDTVNTFATPKLTNSTSFYRLVPLP